MTDKIYICGDSFSSIDTNWPEFHWSERLQKLLPQYEFINLSYPGATNLSISAQVEKAISDNKLRLLILNASDILRIDLPNINLKRKDKSGSIVVSDSKFNYNDFKKISEKIYTEIYKNSFSSVEDFYELFDNYKNNNSVISSFGMWALTKELADETVDRFSQNVYEAAINYYKFMFDLNIRFQNDLSIIEGKIYKLSFKKIPFLYNLGGLTNKNSFLNRVFPHVIKKINKRYDDLKMYHSEINLFDISEKSFITDKNSPNFHIAESSSQQMIANYYYQKINEFDASKINN